jgi:pimeloyl-ACP methyl ester carboxylesterase
MSRTSMSAMTVVALLAASSRPVPLADSYAPGRQQTSAAGVSQVQGVAAIHRDGQTFITWRELDPAPPEALTIAQFNARRQSLAEQQRIRYRVYRAEQPVRTLSQAQLLREAMPLSAWNGDRHGVYPPPDAPVPRYVIEEGKPPLESGTGLFVHKPARPGRAFYVVTAVVAGAENTVIGAANTAEVASEAVGPAPPVLQRVDQPAEFAYVPNPTLRYYVRWEQEGRSSLPGRPFDYLVAIPPKVTYPAPVGIHLHGWGGLLTNGFGWWYGMARGRPILVSTNQIPYDWWTGYHEKLFSGGIRAPADWQTGVVRPYTQTRLLQFVDWLGTTMKIDQTRVFTAGNSMGGSGALMLAIRQPSRIAWSISWVGVHIPAQSPQFRGSYEGVFGKREWGAKFEDGTPVWDYFDDVWYLRRYPDRDIGFLTFSNGKNDGGIGWKQAVDFLKALQETRQPHLFIWGQDGHGQRAVMPVHGGEVFMPLDLRTDKSLPAFSRGSLDSLPGDGDPKAGDLQGQVNAFLAWETESIVDQPDQWSIVLKVVPRAPKSEAVADVTPRRLQHFKLRPGDVVMWTNRVGAKTVQSGEIAADQWGLVTVPSVQITRGGNQLTLGRK